MQVVFVIGMFALAAISILWQAFVLTFLWAWFLVPLFHLPVLPLAYAFGTVLIVTFITHSIEDTKLTDINWGDTIYKTVMHPAVFLFFGWVAHFFL